MAVTSFGSESLQRQVIPKWPLSMYTTVRFTLVPVSRLLRMRVNNRSLQFPGAQWRAAARATGRKAINRDGEDREARVPHECHSILYGQNPFQ